MVNKWQLEHLQSCTSTNSELMERWRNHTLRSPTSIMADEQTSGRGRRGKPWFSSASQSLTFSMAYPFDAHKGMPHLSGLSLFCGLTTLQGIANYLKRDIYDLYELGMGLKWPNDILIENSKLAGILVEGGQTNTQSPIWMIIGIGINLHPRSHDEIPHSIKNSYPITSLSFIVDQLKGTKPISKIDAIELWHCLIETFDEALQQFNEIGFGSFQDAWNSLHLFNQKQVSVYKEDQLVMEGICVGADSSGAIQIDTSTGRQILHSGDISLRLQNV